MVFPGERSYAASPPTGEMRTGVKESLIEDALARLYGKPLAEIQAANMLLGDIGTVALHARHGTLAGEAQLPRPRPARNEVETDLRQVPLEPAVEADAIVILADGEGADVAHDAGA